MMTSYLLNGSKFIDRKMIDGKTNLYGFQRANGEKIVFVWMAESKVAKVGLNYNGYNATDIFGNLLNVTAFGEEPVLIRSNSLNVSQIFAVVESAVEGSCGDGIVQGYESCDGTNLNNNSCSSLGYSSGNLGCNQCKFVTSSCLGTPSYNLGLVAQLSFDGNAVDSSGRGNNGNVFGGVSYVTSNVSGQAVKFDGISGYITLANEQNFDFPGNFSVSIWVKPVKDMGLNLSWQSWQWFVTKSAAQDGRGWALLGDPNQGGANVFFVGDYINSTQGGYDRAISRTLLRSRWYHLVGVYDAGKEISIFVDGREVNNKSVTSAYLNNDWPVAIGRGEYYGGGYFNGTVDQLRIYNRTLNDSEIRALYESGL